MFKNLREDINSVFERDPAARNVFEIIFCYPGLHALWIYRIAHWFWINEFFFLGRFISHLGRFLTGVEIHPGAKIGRKFFIDHGMGVVIGETAQIGDDVLIYQNVTLGGTGKEKGKRHPTIGNHVVVGTGAKVLGNIVLGDYVKVGAGSVVVKSVPQYSTVVGVPGRIVRSRTEPDLADTLEHGKLPDPEGQLIEDLARRIDQLEQTVKLLAEDRVPQ